MVVGCSICSLVAFSPWLLTEVGFAVEATGWLIMVSWLPVPGYGRDFVLFLCPGCGLPSSFR